MWHHGHQQSMWKCFSVHQSFQTLVCLETFALCLVWFPLRKMKTGCCKMWELTVLIIGRFTCVRPSTFEVETFSGCSAACPFAPGPNEFVS
jgi:hypothetical protein